jgi:hypothetical protein
MCWFEDVVEYFRLEIFYGFVVCVVAVGSVCIVVVFLFCILQVVLVDSRITYMCVVIIVMTVIWFGFHKLLIYNTLPNTVNLWQYPRAIMCILGNTDRMT